MLTRIEGVLESIDGSTATVDVGGGFALEVLLPAHLAIELAASSGRRIALHTIVLLEGQAQGASLVPRLLGFAAPEDRAFFRRFTTVKGLGPRRGLRAMAEPPARIAAMIEARDAKGLQSLPEIGKRLAETVVAELHGKLDELGLRAAAPVAPGIAAERKLGPGVELAIEALVRLGRQRGDAERSVERVLVERPELAAAEDADALVAAVFTS